MRTLILAALGVLVASSSVSANDWARSMFTSTNHDFGTVARAAKTEYRFEFENRSNQTIHVRSVRTSCGCTTPSIETETVAPGGTGVILAKFNTHSHTGQRQATVTVTFDKPQFTEVQLLVKGYIRSDIVFNPGEAVFGNVKEGESKSINIDLDYAGRSDWKVMSVGASDNFVQADFKEISRANGRIKYQILATLTGNAPKGALLSELFIKTNDRNLTTVPLRLMANIEPSIAVIPQLVAIGDIKQGEPAKQVLVLKGHQPFRVTEIESADFDVDFQADQESKDLHKLQLTIAPKSQKGEIKGKIFVKTDLDGDTTVCFDATCKVMPQ